MTTRIAYSHGSAPEKGTAAVEPGPPGFILIEGNKQSPTPRLRVARVHDQVTITDNLAVV